ncbi:hypothetical protein [Rathayibacter sp. VKM Ac-2927]|uniref:hypothetical protein n=1 Tax=Rathayibacter sp. VKM Ac-2927 TaxID=2929478 RepID=UPI001FB5532A|nr:hypothetical protein [Rathayibacter sp. VKM Ac-2927]MCJ1688571.1 hypothetical protein [Rathayibacter sp. VKM Ac-2927]
MSDTTDNLGTDGTIPNTPDGIAVGHDPNGSHFNPEEDDATTPEVTAALPDGSGTDAESSVEADDDSDTASGGDAD